MKLSIKNIFAAAMLCGCAVAAMGQSSTGYFSDGYSYNYQLNPALTPGRGYVVIPGAGNINAGLNSNIGLDKLLYNVDGRTTTFMNPKVSSSEFLGNLANINRFQENVRVGLLSFGFKGFNGYNALSINVVNNGVFSLPRSVFELAKEGLTNRTYSIRDLSGRADAYLELALNHSHQINENLRVGATFKFLAGFANVDIEASKADLVLGTDKWSAITNANINASMKGLTYKLDRNSRTGHEYVSGVDYDFESSPNGYGVGLDLGAVYTFRKDFEFSLALTDIGFIRYQTNMLASTNGDRSVELDKYTFNVDDNADNSFDNELDRLGDAFSELYELQDCGDTGGRTVMLGTTLRVGARYKLPLYRKLSFGLLSTTRFQGKYTWTEARASVNIAPLKVFTLTGSAAVGTFGTTVGFMFNLHCPGFGLYLAADHIPYKLCKQMVPMSANGSVSFGINIPIK